MGVKALKQMNFLLLYTRYPKPYGMVVKKEILVLVIATFKTE